MFVMTARSACGALRLLLLPLLLLLVLLLLLLVVVVVAAAVAVAVAAAVVAAAAAAAARAGGLIRTGRSDRLGGRRRSRRKLSIYVQKPLGRVCCAVCSRKVLAPAEGLPPHITQFVHGTRILLFARVGVYRRFVNGTASATRAPCGQSP